MKKILIALGVIIILCITGIFGLNLFFKNKIETFIDNSLSENVVLAYGNIMVNTLQGTIKIDDVSVKLKKTGDTIFRTHIKSEHISMENLSYWDYFIHKRIHVAKIEVGKNSIEHQNRKTRADRQKHTSPAGINKEFIIDQLEIGQTSLKITNEQKDSVKLDLKKATISIEDIKTDPKIISRKIPFTYKNLSLGADSLFVSLNPYDNLSIGNIRINDGRLELKRTSIKTQYSHAQLSRIIKKERDYIDLKIPSMALDGIAWGFAGDSLFTTASVMSVRSPSLDIYRDKLVADDNTVKPLYSKMLRNIPFGVMIDSLKIDDASIAYSERVNSKVKPGQINFSKLKVRGAAIGNTYDKGSKKTKLAIKGYFLDDAPLDVDWSFDINNTKDRFRFLASVGSMDAARINNFTQPNLGAKMSGRVNKVYFDIDGNNYRSDISMKMNYTNFKIEVLNKKSKKNWLFSTIANIFVSKDSKKEGQENFREGQGSAERDKTKSFFNYLWLNVRSGLIKTMTGKG